MAITNKLCDVTMYLRFGFWVFGILVGACLVGGSAGLRRRQGGPAVNSFRVDGGFQWRYRLWATVGVTAWKRLTEISAVAEGLNQESKWRSSRFRPGA